MREWIVVGGLACMAAGCSNTVSLGTSDAGSAAHDASTDDGEEPVDGGDGGATSIASEIQATPTSLVSDGTSLFWVSAIGAGSPVLSIPVGGGPIQTVVAGPFVFDVSVNALAVDDANVYFYVDSGQNAGLDRAPKVGGGSPTLINEADGTVGAVALVGSQAYWVENQGPDGATVAAETTLVKSVPLQGGPVSTIATFSPAFQLNGSAGLGVTATTIFLATPGLTSFPLASGIPDGGMPANVPGVTEGCDFVVSDTNAIYCDSSSSILRVASDGTATTLGSLFSEGGGYSASGQFAVDDTYFYWVDDTPVGTIMRVPKTGGTATILARDTDPVAIAVDANAVYWSDVGGNIMRLAK